MLVQKRERIITEIVYCWKSVLLENYILSMKFLEEDSAEKKVILSKDVSALSRSNKIL